MNSTLKKILLTFLITISLVKTHSPEKVPPSHRGEFSPFPECDEGFFYNRNSTSCEKCHHICKTCTGFKLNCDSCAEGYYFDPLVKIHCLKEGPWHQKFHHFEELFKHLSPPHFHFVPVGGLISYAFTVVFFFIFAIAMYILAFFVCYFGKGININQIDVEEFIELCFCKDLEEIRKRKQERMRQRYREMGGSFEFVETGNQIV